MAKWPKVKLAECVDLLAGFPFKSERFTDNPEDVPLVKGENVSQGCILWGISKRWPLKDWATMVKFHLLPGDIIVAMDRPWVPAGLKWAFITESDPKALLVQRCARLRSNDGRLDQSFLRFVIGGPGFENYVIPITTGVNVPHISGQQILDFEFTLPPLPVQQRIAGVLLAYDKLIQISQRRIQILEAMAHSCYREWFVDFRFPGHKKLSRIAPPLDDIPQSCELKQLGDVFRTVLGGTPSRSKPEFWEGGTIPWINSGKVNDLRITAPSELITELALERSAVKLMPKGTTVLAITGATLGQVSYLEMETAANQSVVGIVDPSGLYSEWIYLTMKDRISGIINHASGGAQQHINKEVVNSVLVAVPPEQLAKRFQQLVGPMFRELATLLFQIHNLRRTRDLLLPRLLSGQVSLATD